jgi:hypothetical protein
MCLRHQLRHAPAHGSDDLDFDDGARQLVAVGVQQLAQCARLGFLDDELDERRGVDVDQSRSSRMS